VNGAYGADEKREGEIEKMEMSERIFVFCLQCVRIVGKPSRIFPGFAIIHGRLPIICNNFCNQSSSITFKARTGGRSIFK